MCCARARGLAARVGERHDHARHERRRRNRRRRRRIRALLVLLVQAAAPSRRKGRSRTRPPLRVGGRARERYPSSGHDATRVSSEHDARRACVSPHSLSRVNTCSSAAAARRGAEHTAVNSDARRTHTCQSHLLLLLLQQRGEGRAAAAAAAAAAVLVDDDDDDREEAPLLFFFVVVIW